MRDQESLAISSYVGTGKVRFHSLKCRVQR